MYIFHEFFDFILDRNLILIIWTNTIWNFFEVFSAIKQLKVVNSFIFENGTK